MALNTRGSFLEFISNIVITDDAICAHKENKKRKVVIVPFGSAPLKYQMVYHPHPTYWSRQHQHQHPQQQWASYPPQGPHQQAAPRALPLPSPMLCRPVPLTAGTTFDHIYFNCSHTGHFARDCTAPKKSMTQGHVSHPPHGQQNVVVTKTGHVNYTTMEDIPEGEQALTGTFSLNGHPIVIMFDSGATHDFISKACTQKHQLVIEHMHTPYMISMPRGKNFTRQVVVNPLST
jgi:hypothetical protein